SIELTNTVIVMSYDLTETNAAKTLERLLANNPTLEALFILEPTTSQDGRKLQALREILLQHGFDLWAPCPHTGDCPLLKDSDKDWCHDRLVPALPSWWSEMEAHLPMKNRTITVSYLLARKKKKNVSGPAMVRVIGDRLEEKTKIRQMICRGPSREFISWFPSRLSRLQIENSDFSVADFRLERGDLFQSHDTLWSDRRGHERSHEFRLDLQATQHIHETVVRHAHARKNVSETE
ncbi:MAG: small ribosomal subunit Rsm22 family protein, partial [Bdellovibrionales bacterium]|nr:small ribosomal subunit Rsm22 family protein [Bdellovibrionales bacterium]